MGYQDGQLKIFSGNANYQLAQDIADYLGLQLGDIEVGRFSNGEIKVSINESVRGNDVFVIQPTSAPVNENLMELLIIMDALKRASARRVTAVIPFYGYARQDRKTRGREPITARLVANMITVAGAKRVLTTDLHAGQIQGFFDIPVDHLTAVPLLAEYFAQKFNREDMIVVSPDTGGVPRARDLANRLGVPIAIVEKRRPEPNVSEVMNVIGKVDGKIAIMIDDIIDTAGTMVEGAKALLERGAREVCAAGTHAVFSGPAIERLENSPIKDVVITDTIPPQRAKVLDKVKVLSVAPLMAEAIMRIHEDMSVSKLF